METVYTRLKVNNEIELCEFEDMNFKNLIEKELLKNRISFFMKWNATGLFKSNKKQACILCINENQCEQVEEIISNWKRRIRIRFVS